MVIHATLLNCTLGKPLFISSNQVTFFFEKSENNTITITIFQDESFKNISKMLVGFFKKGSNMYGFNEIILNTIHTTIRILPNDTENKIEQDLLNLTRMAAYTWEDTDT